MVDSIAVFRVVPGLAIDSIERQGATRRTTAGLSDVDRWSVADRAGLPTLSASAAPLQCVTASLRRGIPSRQGIHRGMVSHHDMVSLLGLHVPRLSPTLRSPVPLA